MGSVTDQQEGLGYMPSMPCTSSCHGVCATTAPYAACQSRQHVLISTSWSIVTPVHESHIPEGHRSCHQLSLDQLGRTKAVLAVLTAAAAAAPAVPDVAAGDLTNVVCGLGTAFLCVAICSSPEQVPLQPAAAAAELYFRV